MLWLLATVVVVDCVFSLTPGAANNSIVFDDADGYGRVFDGIGGLSGGGATSKLLVNYKKEIRDEILDFLFLPNFGASLHILKVEIGGDAQTSDGTEASHMHYSWDENYERGYEWWLMLEAKKRNPDIKLYALPWGFPGWIGQGQTSPYTNVSVLADYVVRWINGAKTQYNLTIDYVGIWNERNYDVNYIKTLRALLNERGFQNVLIIASDNGWDICKDIKKDAELAKDIYAVGVHYPGTNSPPEALSSTLWSSEDYSTFNDENGAGCWARSLNQNYVNGYFTSTIAWDLIASYYSGLPYYRDGLMTAVEPWSGNYVVQSHIWVSAHTTQFTSIGWKYLNHTSGVGKLPQGGSYVGLVSPSGSDLTIVIETMTHDHSICIRPSLPKYDVKAQDVIITLESKFASITQLYVWYSQLNFNGGESQMFVNRGPVKVVNGTVQLSLGLDEIYTLTTLSTGKKGSYPDSPPSSPFPLPYTDDFEGYRLNEEPYYLSQQTGSFEVLREGGNQFIRQMVTDRPLSWCEAEKVNKSISVIGSSAWNDTFIEVDFKFPDVNASSGVFVAVRINQAGCDLTPSNGIYFFITSDNKFTLANDPRKIGVLATGAVSATSGWHRLSLLVMDLKAYAAYDGKVLFNSDIPQYPPRGFAGIGTDSFGLADFDNLYIGTSQDGITKMKSYLSNSIPQPLYFKSERD